MRAEVRFVIGDDGPPWGRNGVQAFVVVLVERYFDGTQVVFELLHRTRPDNGAGDTWLVFAPGQGDLPRGAVLLGRYGLDRFLTDWDALFEEVMSA